MRKVYIWIIPFPFSRSCRTGPLVPLMQPSCADEKGAMKTDAPAWCADSWCFVDEKNCNIKHAVSAYFPGSELYFSYGTCGKESTFGTWIGTPTRPLACT